jgi:hypothetical protein
MSAVAQLQALRILIVFSKHSLEGQQFSLNYFTLSSLIFIGSQHRISKTNKSFPTIAARQQPELAYSHCSKFW